MIDETLSQQPVVLPNATAVSLDLPNYLSFEQWLGYLTYVHVVERACHWWLGDLLNAAERFGYSNEAIQAIDEMGFAAQTASNAKSVCSRLPKERRRPELTFSHHAVTAYLDAAVADSLLDEAAKKHWTVRELRDAHNARLSNVRRGETGLGGVRSGQVRQGEALLSKVTTNGAAPSQNGAVPIPGEVREHLIDLMHELTVALRCQTLPEEAYEMARELREALDKLRR